VRAARVAAIAALALAGCGSSKPDAMPAACRGDHAALTAALARAPAPVSLAGGTRLSRCVSTAGTGGDLQSLGIALTQIADELRARADRDGGAALQLGYLVGAVRRGAAGTPGIASQLARRVEASSAPQLVRPGPRAQLERGIRLGEAGG
jgi:hypothetical protein